jgi:hypothetical protein
MITIILICGIVYEVFELMSIANRYKPTTPAFIVIMHSTSLLYLIGMIVLMASKDPMYSLVGTVIFLFWLAKSIWKKLGNKFWFKTLDAITCLVLLNLALVYTARVKGWF